MDTARTFAPQFNHPHAMRATHARASRRWSVHRRAATLAALCFWLLATACGGGGGGDDASAPTRPATSISGAVAGPVSGAAVWAYALSDGERGAQLSERAVNTDAAGRFTLSLAVPDQLLLLAATGGRYTEAASEREVALGRNDALYAAALFRSGEPLEPITVSVLSHWAAACLMSGRYGDPSATALDACDAAGRDIFGVSPRGQPVLPHVSGAGWEDAGVRYGFVLSGISELMADVSQRNNSEPHHFYTSMRFADLLYRDMRADGMLDGMDGGEQLDFGAVAVSATLYRRGLGLGILAALASERNRTEATVAAALSDVSAMAGNRHAVFAAALAELLDESGPDIASALPDGAQVHGMLFYTLLLADISGVDRAEVSLGDTRQVLRGATPTFVVDTTTLADGEHSIDVRAYDALGNIADKRFSVQVRNTGPAIDVDGAGAHSNQARYPVSGAVSGAVSVRSVHVNGQPAMLKDGRFLGEAELQEGDNQIMVSAVDALGNASTRSVSVVLDTQTPTFSFQDSMVVYWHETQPYQDSFSLADRVDGSRLLHMPVAVFNPTGTLTASAFSARRLPHYRFSVSDPFAPGATPAAALAPMFRYQLGSELDSGWQPLRPLDDELPAGEYALLLASDRLPPGWHNASSADVHTVRFQVSDRAGNRAEVTRRFRARFSLHRVAVRSQLAGADARLFQYRPGNALPGGSLGQCRTDANGRCEIALLADPQALYLRVSGGSLAEWASPVVVRLAAAQGLLSLADYAGGDIAYSNTVFSHLQSALAMHLAERNPEHALAESARRFAAAYGVDPVSTPFTDVRERTHDAGALSQPLRYGYLLAGVSEATLDLSRTNRDADHSRYHSYWFADTQWRDLRDDGRADGIGPNGPIMLGAARADVDVWRFALARGIVDFLRSERHALSFQPADLLADANVLAASRDLMFSGLAGQLVDIATPSITVRWPVAEPLSGSLSIGFTLRDAGPLSASLSLDSQPLALRRSGNEATAELDTRTLADGQHRMALIAVDAQGNIADWERSFASDNTEPVIVISERPSSRWLRGVVRFAFSASDMHLLSVTLRVDGAPRAHQGSMTAPSLALDTAELADGAHSLTIQARDAAGHSTATALVFDSDNLPPVIRFLAPRRDWHSGALAVAFQAQDAHLSTVTVSVDGRPAAYVGTPGGGTLLLDTSEFADGAHAVMVRAQDFAAFDSSATWRFNSDNSPPALTLDAVDAVRSDGNRVGGIAEFRFRAADVSLATVELRLDGQPRAHGASDASPQLRLDTETMADGRHQLSLAASDQTGRTARLEHVFVVDNAPPVVDAVVMPPNPLLSGTAQFAWLLLESALSEVELTLDDALLDHGNEDSRPRLALDTSELSDGMHALRLRARDALGQATTWTYTFHSDNHAPLITLQATSGSVLAADSPVLSGRVMLEFLVSDTSLASVQASLDGAALAYAGNASSPTLTLAADDLADGEHRLELVARDRAGYVARYAYPFSVDNNAPTIVPLSMPEGFWLGGDAVFQWQVGGDGLASASLDGAPVAANALERDATRWTLRVDSAALSDGVHQLQLRAVDAQGHHALWPRAFGVDNSDPVIHFAPPQSPLSGTVRLALRVDDVSPSTLTVAVDGATLFQGLLDSSASLSLDMDSTVLMDGAHPLRLDVVDAVGRSATLSFRFVSDNSPPRIVPSFAPPGRLHGAVQFAFQVLDPHLDAVTATLDGNALNHGPDSSSPTLALDTTALADGEHRIALSASDSLGHSDAWRMVFVVDNSPPDIEALVPQGVALSGSEVLLFVIDDQALSSVSISLDGRPLTYLGGLHRPKILLDTTALVDGTHRLRVEAVNVPGYRSEWAQDVLVDNHAPVIAVAAEPAADVVSGTVRFAFSVRDVSLQSTRMRLDGEPLVYSGGDSSPTLALDTTDLADGAHSLELLASDLNGRSAAFQRQFRVDNDAPGIAVQAPASPLSGMARFAFSVTDIMLAAVELSLDGMPRAWQGSLQSPVLELDTTTLADGPHALRLQARDVIGHVTLREFAFLVDNHAPSIVPDRELGPVLADAVSLSWTIQDASLATALVSLDDRDLAFGDDLARPAITLDPAAIGEGPHRLAVVAVDMLGRSSRWTRQFTADRRPPQILELSDVLSAGQALMGVVELAFSVEDASLDAVTFTVDGQQIDHGSDPSRPAVSLDTQLLPDGSHQLALVAIDRLGRASSARWTVSVDNAPPLLRLTSPLSGWQSGELSLSWAVDDAHPSTLRISLDERPLDWRGSLSSPTVTLDSADLADGEYRLHMVAQDRFGRSAEASWPLMVDNAKPLISTLSKPTGSWLGGFARFQWSIVDASLVSVSVTVDGSRISHGNDPTRPELLLDTTALVDGAHVIVVSAVDALGRNAVDSTALRVDNSSPTVTLSTALGDWLSGQVLFEYQVSDSSLHNVRIELDGVLVAHSGMAANPYWLLDSALHADGRHQLRLRAEDRSGHSATHELHFGIDNNPPVASIDAPASWSRGEVVIAIAASDTSLQRFPEVLLDGTPLSSPTVTWTGERSELRAELRVDTRALADGRHTLALRAMDAIGRIAESQAELLVDNHAPSISYAVSGTRGARGWLSGAQTLRYVVEDIALRELVIMVDATEIGRYQSSSGTVTLHTTTMPDGMRRLQLLALDQSGQSQREEAVLPVDNTPPGIEAQIQGRDWRPSTTTALAGRQRLRFALDNGAAGAGPLSASLSLSDSSGNTTVLAETLGQADIAHDLETILHADGDYRLSLRVEDGAGHRNDRNDALRFDNSAPQAQALFAHGLDAPWRRGMLELAFAVSDASDTTASLTVQGAALVALPPRGATTTLRFALDSAELDDGHHFLRLSLVDSLGNRRTLSYVIRTDNTPPVMVLLSSRQSMFTSSGQYPVRFSEYHIRGYVVGDIANHWTLTAKFSFGGTTTIVPVDIAAAGSFEHSVLIPANCCLNSIVSMRLSDPAGNVSQVQYTLNELIHSFVPGTVIGATAELAVK